MCGQRQSIKGLTGTRSWKGKICSVCFSWVSVFSWSQMLNLLVVRLSDSDGDLCQWLPWFSGLWVWAEMVSLVILGLPPPYRWWIMGFLNLHNHVWQSFRRNLFLNISPSLYPIVSISSVNPDQYIRFVRMSVVMCVSVFDKLWYHRSSSMRRESLGLADGVLISILTLLSTSSVTLIKSCYLSASFLIWAREMRLLWGETEIINGMIHWKTQRVIQMLCSINQGSGYYDCVK